MPIPSNMAFQKFDEPEQLLMETLTSMQKIMKKLSTVLKKPKILNSLPKRFTKQNVFAEISST